ncbi:hypothetical protein C8J57DRAFT_1240466 [Mycena rebaudengoi]|nr:hypothetical protein C8J57DRAFT_1240466 [Mycena rebaudengoi]
MCDRPWALTVQNRLSCKDPGIAPEREKKRRFGPNTLDHRDPTPGISVKLGEEGARHRRSIEASSQSRSRSSKGRNNKYGAQTTEGAQEPRRQLSGMILGIQGGSSVRHPNECSEKRSPKIRQAIPWPKKKTAWTKRKQARGYFRDYPIVWLVEWDHEKAGAHRDSCLLRIRGAESRSGAYAGAAWRRDDRGRVRERTRHIKFASFSATHLPHSPPVPTTPDVKRRIVEARSIAELNCRASCLRMASIRHEFRRVSGSVASPHTVRRSVACLGQTRRGEEETTAGDTKKCAAGAVVLVKPRSCSEKEAQGSRNRGAMGWRYGQASIEEASRAETGAGDGRTEEVHQGRAESMAGVALGSSGRRRRRARRCGESAAQQRAKQRRAESMPSAYIAIIAALGRKGREMGRRVVSRMGWSGRKGRAAGAERVGGLACANRGRRLPGRAGGQGEWREEWREGRHWESEWERMA